MIIECTQIVDNIRGRDAINVAYSVFGNRSHRNWLP